MHSAVDLHHKARFGGEVDDIPFDHNLAAKSDAQARRGPEPHFRRRLMATHVLRSGFELALALGDLATLIR